MIREMVVKDLGQVSILSEELGYPNAPVLLQKRYEILIKSEQHGLFVYSENHKVLGWIHLQIIEDLIEKTKVEIKALVVAESFRGQGIGEKLIKFAKKWAKSKGFSTVMLSCNIIRERTHRFYIRESFKITKTSHIFEIEL